VGAREDDLGVVVLEVFFLTLDTIGYLATSLHLVRPKERGQGGALHVA
jgi:hypothetical protein